ncbi:MAG: patatin-like phospholipase family protein [Candidatus Bipolaricaulota bacterium]|nr:patatin-like phospholipase family protein [Candidatus Bipolaricaulota bacterium]
MRPVIGLALGGGGARGYAHIGVIRTLTAHGVPIDVVAGTSMGAVIGGAYACGLDLYKIEKILKNLDVNRLLGIPDTTLRGLESLAGKTASEYLFKKADWRLHEPLSLKQLYAFLQMFTGERSFEDLSVPLGVVACDIDTGEEIVLRSGKLYRAIAASIAFPGVHPPVPLGGRFLVDGGLVNKVPVDVAVAMGAEIVIAVDVGAPLNPHVTTSLDVLIQSNAITSQELVRLKLELMRQRLGERLIVIRPRVDRIKLFELRQLDLPIYEGERATAENLGLIQEIVAKYSQAPVDKQPAA